MIFGVKRDNEIIIHIGEACLKEIREQNLASILHLENPMHSLGVEMPIPISPSLMAYQAISLKIENYPH